MDVVSDVRDNSRREQTLRLKADDQEKIKQGGSEES